MCAPLGGRGKLGGEPLRPITRDLVAAGRATYTLTALKSMCYEYFARATDANRGNCLFFCVFFVCLFFYLC